MKVSQTKNYSEEIKMPSHDLRATIERYPCYDEKGNLESVSYGCPGLDLMGYMSLPKLMQDVAEKFIKDGLIEEINSKMVSMTGKKWIERDELFKILKVHGLMEWS